MGPQPHSTNPQGKKKRISRVRGVVEPSSPNEYLKDDTFILQEDMFMSSDDDLRFSWST